VRWLRSSCPPISGGANASRTQTEVEGDTEMKFRKLLVVIHQNPPCTSKRLPALL
jgi:hypothetical protein